MRLRQCRRCDKVYKTVMRRSQYCDECKLKNNHLRNARFSSAELRGKSKRQGIAFYKRKGMETC